MRAARLLLIVGPTASLMLAGCGGSGSGSSSATTPQSATTSATALVRSAQNGAVGATVLVDSRGMTLYHLTGEQGGRFICTTSACLQVWHPLTAAGAPTGSVGSLATVKRPDGTVQVTYKGFPLYTFAQDQAGQARGQGFKDVGTWTAVTVTPAAATTTTAPTETTTSGGSGRIY